MGCMPLRQPNGTIGERWTVLTQRAGLSVGWVKKRMMFSGAHCSTISSTRRPITYPPPGYGAASGGLETLLQAMRSFIETRGGEFRLKCPVSRVVFENRQTRGVEAQGKFHPFH